MSKRSIKDMILSLEDLNISNEEMSQAMEIMTAVNDAMVESNQKVGFEHVVLWWIGCEPAEAWFFYIFCLTSESRRAIMYK